MTREISKIIKCNPSAALIRSEWTGEKITPKVAPKTAAPVFGKRAAK